MKSASITVLRGLLVLCFLSAAARLRADDAPSLPMGITSTLDTEYPGWNLAPISKLLIPLDARDRYTNLIERDLDHDGKVDYAIAVNYIDAQNNVQTIALVFLA